MPGRLIPNRNGQHIPIEINEGGDVQDETEENERPPEQIARIDEEELEYQKKAHILHAFRKAIQTYGAIEGCPVCNVINRRGHMFGKSGCNHSVVCRTRIIEAMR